MRIIGLDIHRAFAEAVAWQEGKLKRIGRIDMRRDQLTAFAASLLSTDVSWLKRPATRPPWRR
jgi:transposase